jgi:radical SAM protein with 4Fe4S-binding SPASM domain
MAHETAVGPSSEIARQPGLIVWEATRAFRFPGTADARPAELRARPGELTTHEAVAMLDQLEPFAGTVLGITGGDPLEREDLELIVTRARIREFPIVLALGATPRVTVHRLRKLRTLAGEAEVAVRLDGATAESHDALRGFRGAYRRTLDIVQAARNAGFSVRVITTVSRRNVDELDAMAEIVAVTGANRWSVTFLAPVGRGNPADVLDAGSHERVLVRLAHLWRGVPFGISVPSSPSFVRVMAQAGHPPDAAIAAASDGRGFMFISSTGDVRPSRVLPTVGNVREESPVRLYRAAPLFTALRDPERLEGRCGECEFREICGGSRSAAYIASGDPFAEDPTCPWEPRGAS